MLKQTYPSCFCICILVSVTTAFPGYTSLNASPQKKKVYCDTLAIKTVIEDLEPPVVHSNFRQIPEDILDSEVPLYDNPVKWDLIKTMKDILETTESNLHTRSVLETQIAHYANKILEDYYRVRESCLAQLTISGQYPDVSATGNQFGDASNILEVSGTRSDQLFKRGGGQSLTLNPTGWRKRRETSKENDEEYETFLRNMSQLLEKRRRRLQFNPTGW